MWSNGTKVEIVPKHDTNLVFLSTRSVSHTSTVAVKLNEKLFLKTECAITTFNHIVSLIHVHIKVNLLILCCVESWEAHYKLCLISKMMKQSPGPSCVLIFMLEALH